MGSRLRRTLLSLLGILALFFVPFTASYGQSVNYYYDDLNRLTRIDYGGTVIDYTYDDVGNRETETMRHPPSTTANPAGGTYNTSQSVTLTCADPQGPGCGSIYYTTNGTAPTTSSPVYTSAIPISATTTLKYFARDVANPPVSESVKSQTYTIIYLPTTTASPAGGVYNAAQSVTLTCTDPQGPGCDKIYYTTDGSTPTTSSSIYSSPISISVTTTLKFFARDLAGNIEAVKSQTYTISTGGGTTFNTSSSGVNYAINDSGFFVSPNGFSTANAQSLISGSNFHIQAASPAGDVGIVLYFNGGLTLGSLQSVTINTVGSTPLNLNLWLDTGGDGMFFAFNGTQLTSLNGDSYAGGGPQTAIYNSASSFYMLGGNGAGGTYTLAQLQGGMVPGIGANTLTALWIGANAPITADISSITVNTGSGP